MHAQEPSVGGSREKGLTAAQPKECSIDAFIISRVGRARGLYFKGGGSYLSHQPERLCSLHLVILLDVYAPARGYRSKVKTGC